MPLTNNEGKCVDIINDKYTKLDDFALNFKNASPFPYVVLDNFLQKEYFDALANEISVPGDATRGKTFNTEYEKNKWISTNNELPPLLTDLISALNSKEWVDNLKRFTGIQSLVQSFCGNTLLANYHVMKPGGFLAPHVDHAQDPETGLPHVLNIILYLSPQWDPANGGSTLLYDKCGKNIMAKVEYKPNRAVIFLHTPYSFHCVEQIKPNLSMVRRTVYVDYYSESKNPYKDLDLSFPNNWFSHGTTFILPNIFSYLNIKNAQYTKAYIKYALNRILS